MRTLLKHAMIVTMNEKGEVYTDGNLLFEDDRIVQVGKEAVKGKASSTGICQYPCSYLAAACKRTGRRCGLIDMAS